MFKAGGSNRRAIQRPEFRGTRRAFGWQGKGFARPEAEHLNMKTSVISRALIGVAAVGLLVGWRVASDGRRGPRGGLVTVQRTLMGTLWSVEVADGGAPEKARAAIERAYTELERIDALMSEWKPESPISQVDAAAGKTAVEVPAELREMIERSVRYSEETGGTFDITWRGMGKLWHFDDSFVPPSEEAIRKARRMVDYRRIRVEGNRIYLPAGMSIGLGGIAKGYAIDRAGAVLRAAGFENWFVDGGGDVLVSGTRFGEPWTVGIQDPRRPRGELIGVVRLSNAALASSGDYERYRIVNGVRYHHIIDPRTGRPASAAMASSVIAASAEQGVVIGKGVFILGPQAGLALAEREGVEALLIDPHERRYLTPGFRKALETE